jgi:hypothetical protein
VRGSELIQGSRGSVPVFRERETIIERCMTSKYVNSCLRMAKYGGNIQGGRPKGRSSSPRGVKNFPFSIPALGSTQPRIQWIRRGRGLFHLGQSGRSVNLITYDQLVPKSRKYLCIHSPIRRHGVALKHKDNFIFLLYCFKFRRSCKQSCVTEGLKCKRRGRRPRWDRSRVDTAV